MSTDIFEDLYRQRAIEAFRLVNEAGKGMDENDEKAVRLRAICRRLPAMIHENGLLTTLLFLEKKSEKESAKESDKESDKESENGTGNIYKQLGEGIVKWLKEYNALINPEEENNGQNRNFLRYLIEGGGTEKESFRAHERMLTREALEFTSWMKRCAE